MSDILVRDEADSNIVRTVSSEDLELMTKVRGFSVFLTKKGNWIVRLPAAMMAGIPYISPLDSTLLNLLLQSPRRGHSDEIDSKIDELSL